MEYEEILDYVRKLYSEEQGFKGVSYRNKLKNDLKIFDSTPDLLKEVFEKNNLSKILEFIKKIEERIGKIAITRSFETHAETIMLGKFLSDLRKAHERKKEEFVKQKINFFSLSLISKRFCNDMLDLIGGKDFAENTHTSSTLENQTSNVRFQIESEIISDLELLSQNLPQTQRKKLELEK